jgi:hypothetical protein
MFPCLFPPLARLSHDSNIFRTFVTDGEGLHDVWYVLVHAGACGAESGTEERMAARTAA